MDPSIALLASPLLGPASWGLTASALRTRGLEAVVVAHEGLAPSSAASVVDAFVAGLDASRDWLLVPHSNAGLLAPAVARSRRVRGVVYVDARLPEAGLQPMRPPSALAFLADRADSSGYLPPWSAWWNDDVSHLFPSRATQRECEAEMRRLPMSYFEDCVDGTGWDGLPSAYLAFGRVYADECHRAAAAGWPTATIENAEHLQILMDPEGTASQLISLIAALRIATC